MAVRRAGIEGMVRTLRPVGVCGEEGGERERGGERRERRRERGKRGRRERVCEWRECVRECYIICT